MSMYHSPYCTELYFNVPVWYSYCTVLYCTCVVLVLGGGDDPAAGVLDLAARAAGGGGAHAGHCGQVQHRREPSRGKPLLQLSFGVFQTQRKAKQVVGMLVHKLSSMAIVPNK